MFFTDRIKLYLKINKISQQKFYKLTGLSNGSLSANNMRSDNVEIVVSTFGDLNPEWLLTGKGEMLRDSVETTATPPVEKQQSHDVLDRLERLAAENALLKKENDELKARLGE